MPNASSVRIPKYRKHQSGQARVTIGGKTCYLGNYNSPESRAHLPRAVRNMAASSRNGSLPAALGARQMQRSQRDQPRNKNGMRRLDSPWP